MIRYTFPLLCLLLLSSIMGPMAVSLIAEPTMGIADGIAQELSGK